MEFKFDSDPCTPAEYARTWYRDDYFFLDPDANVYESYAWWESLKPWFQEQGYTLYRQKDYDPEIGKYVEAPTSVYTGTACFPYAYIGGDGDCDLEGGCIFQTRDFYARLVFAQDSQSRHVCIRILRPNSDEYKIISLLHQHSKSWDGNNFPCVTPVLDIFGNEKFQFAVFPRWDGDLDMQLPWYNSMGEILDFIRCTLKGLCYLHDNRIFHRDIHDGNFLVNHFGCGSVIHTRSNLLRQELRSMGQLTYAYTDFDLSLLLPADADIKTYQLPITASYSGVFERPYGVIHGELYFNPFAYDVGCLGIMLADQFQHLCASLPILAPLMDGMLTSDITKRFTAHEALAFFDENRPKLYEYEALEPEERDGTYDWKTYDRWSSVPPTFLGIWAKYRERRPSYFLQRIVGPLCRRAWGLNLVYSVRYILQFEFLKPILRWFRPSRVSL